MCWTFSERSHLHIHNSTLSITQLFDPFYIYHKCWDCVLRESCYWDSKNLMASCHCIQIKAFTFTDANTSRGQAGAQAEGLGRTKKSMGLLYSSLSVTTVLRSLTSQNPALKENLFSLPRGPLVPVFSVCKSDSSPLIKKHKGYCMKSSSIWAENAEACSNKNGHFDWITYICRTVSSDQTWVCLHLDILPLPEALSALPSNIHLSPPSWPDTALDWSFSSTKDNTLYLHLQHTTCPRCGVHLIYQNCLFNVKQIADFLFLFYYYFFFTNFPLLHS